jgi:hypothetical protein
VPGLYAWLRRNPRLVDGALALLLIYPGGPPADHAALHPRHGGAGDMLQTALTSLRYRTARLVLSSLAIGLGVASSPAPW